MKIKQKKVVRWISVLMVMALAAIFHPAYANDKLPIYTAPDDVIAQAKKEGTLYIYDWAEWWPEELYTNFEKEFGIKVIRDNYASADEMISKFRLNPGTKYDLINVGITDVIKLKKMGALKKLNHDWVPNMTNYLMADFKDMAYDPGYEYMSPDNVYLTGIAYNSKYVPDDTKNLFSWKAIFEGDQFNGRMTQLDDSYTAIGSALMYLGYNPNSDDEKELDAAKAVLLKQKSKLIAYDSSPNRLLAEEECVVSVMWAGDVFWAKSEQPALKLALPENGTMMGVGGMVIGKGGPSPAAAHLFLNYLWRPKNMAMLIEGIGYSSTHKAVFDLLSDEAKVFPSIAPSEEYLSKCKIEEERAALGKGRTLRAKIWEEVKK
jgi:spermidine/putrescine transport system substrate-binding protein